jgi:outer membrane lipoprotein-sorting protein
MFIAVLVSAGMLFSQTPVDVDAGVDEFFKEFTAKRKVVRVLRADFVQKTIAPDETLFTDGRLLYVQPRRVLFETEEPERILLADGVRVFEHEPPLKQCVAYSMEDNPQLEIFFLAFESDASKIRTRYAVRLEPGEDGAHVLYLAPKPEDEDEAVFREVRLELDAENMLPRAIQVRMEEGSELRIDVKSAAVNGPLKPEETQLNLPEGTTFIDENDQVERIRAEGKRIPKALTPLEEPAPAMEVKPLNAPAEDAQP